MMANELLDMMDFQDINTEFELCSFWIDNLYRSVFKFIDCIPAS